MEYFLINIHSRAMLSAPEALPDFLIGLAQTGPGSIEDLSWTTPNFDNFYVGKGYWAVQNVYPVPEAWQHNAETPTYTVDPNLPIVLATYELEDKPLDQMRIAKINSLANYRSNKVTEVVQAPISEETRAYINQCFAIEQQHKNNIDLLTTSELVSKYDFTTGWPS